MSSDPSRNNRILIIDDNPAIHNDFRKILAGGGGEHPAFKETKTLLFGDDPASSSQTGFEITSAYQGQEGLRAAQEAAGAGKPFALAFVDVRMPPGWDGVETVRRIWQEQPQLQIVICTAFSDYSWEEVVRRLGAPDSLLILKKPFDNIEVLQMAHALAEKWRLSHELKSRMENLDTLAGQRTVDLQRANEQLTREVAGRMLADAALRLSEERFSRVFRLGPLPLAMQAFREETYVDVNQAFEHLTGFSRDELLGHTPQALNLCGNTPDWQIVWQTLRDHKSVRNVACQLRTKNGALHPVLVSADVLDWENAPVVLSVALDLVDREKVER